MHIIKRDVTIREADRLVESCILILRSLLQGEMSVNMVIRQTGLYKERVFPALDELYRAKLTSITLHPKHRQKKMNRLTTTGVELAELFQSADRFQQSHSKLADFTAVNFNTISRKESELKGKLRAKGWSSRDIPHFEEWQAETRNFVTASSQMFITAICSRFLSLVYQYINSRNELGYRILTKFFTDTIGKHGKTLFTNEAQKTFNVGKFEVTLPSRNESIQKAISFPISNHVILSLQRYIQDENSGLNSRLMKEKVRDTVNSLYLLVNPRVKFDSKDGTPTFKI
jgi:hypothetical protein